jgi:hypothetical protein
VPGIPDAVYTNNREGINDAAADVLGHFKRRPTAGVNYQLLGAMLGTVWRESHPAPGWGRYDQARVIRIFVEQLGLYGRDTPEEAALTKAMFFSIQGLCALCGSSEGMERSAEGVCICASCRPLWEA